jgi:DNA-binding MarR family transcriptional regulator
MTKHHSIGRLTSHITHITHLYLTTHLQKYHISSGQLPLLMRLYHQDGIHQEQLAHDLLIDKTTCTRQITKLVEAGLITKENDPTDKRANKIYLTDKAHTIKKDVRNILRTWRNILLQDFTTEDQHQFLTYLQRTIKNAQTFLNEHNQTEP